MTPEKLKSLLHYDAVTGVWTWLVSSKRVRAGTRAGSVNNGYRSIRVEGKLYRSARLAVFYMTGEWPSTTVDHINRIKTDDRWNNLRVATQTEQNINQDTRLDNTSGVRGVHKMKNASGYQAYISVHKKRINLGYFPTLDSARTARQIAEECYHK